MNFPFFQQFTDWTGPLGFFSACLLLLVFLLLFTHYLLPYLWTQIKKEQLYRRLPSPVTSPLLGRILGHLELYWNAPAEMKAALPFPVLFYRLLNQLVRPMAEAGESLLFLRLGPFHRLPMVIRGKAAKALLRSSKHLEKAFEYKFIGEILGKGLLTGSVTEWKVRRKLIGPSFHSEILHKFLPAMNAHSRVFCRVIRSKMDPSTGKVFLPDIRPLTANCTLDILSETVMGVKVNSQEKKEGSAIIGEARLSAQQIADLFFTGTDLICERLATPELHSDFLFRLSGLGRKTAKGVAAARQVTNLVISERKATLSKQIADCATVEQARARLTDGGKRLSFLDCLLVNHLKGDEKVFNLTFIQDEVTEFLAAGMDTTSTTLQMALLHLGLHPDKQALLHQELDAIFGDDTERPVSQEDLRQMTYLEMCIKETLRLYPGAPLIGRILSEDLQMGEYLVPGGTTVIVNIAAIHRDPVVWTQADDFLPERFSADSAELGLSNSFLPFSAGPRNCIGSRFALFVLKIFLATLFRHYTVHSLTAVEDVQLSCYPLVKPHSPISIEFTQRN